MYNGIGLTTPRGTGTSGHVQKNAATVRSGWQPRGGRGRGVGGRGRGGFPPRHQAVRKVADARIVAHEKRRAVEVAVVELEEALEERGYTEEERREKGSVLRAQLLAENLAEEEVVNRRPVKESQVHRAADWKQRETEKMRRALSVSEDYEEGAAFKRMKPPSEKPQNDLNPDHGGAAANPAADMHAGSGPGEEGRHQLPADNGSDSSSSLSSSSLSERSLGSEDGWRDERPRHHGAVEQTSPRGQRREGSFSSSGSVLGDHQTRDARGRRDSSLSSRDSRRR